MSLWGTPFCPKYYIVFGTRREINSANVHVRPRERITVLSNIKERNKDWISLGGREQALPATVCSTAQSNQSGASGRMERRLIVAQEITGSIPV